MLTGRDTDEIILNQLSDKDLAAVCSVNQIAKRFCDRQDFWRRRIVNKYGIKALPKFTDDYKSFYRSGQVKAYSLCQSIPHKSQLVVEDFYRPNGGIYDKYWTRDVEGVTYLLLKIAYNKAEGADKEKIAELIIKERNEIPEWRFFENTLDLTEEELSNFQSMISVSVGAPELLRVKARTDPTFVKSVSPDPVKTFRFLEYIHKGFNTGKIPLDILWSELCQHSYVLAY